MSRFDSFRYVIVDYDDITDTMISQTQTEREYVFVCPRGPKRGILRYVVNHKPSSLVGITSYTHDQILSITEDPDGDWAPQYPEIPGT